MKKLILISSLFLVNINLFAAIPQAPTLPNPQLSPPITAPLAQPIAASPTTAPLAQPIAAPLVQPTNLPLAQPIAAPLAQSTAAPLAPPTAAPLAPPVNPLDYAIQTRIISGKYELDLCSSLPLSGEVGIIGTQILTGLQACLLKLKTLPDFNFYIKFEALDDRGNMTKTIENIIKLNKKTPLFTSLFGSNAMESLIPYLKQNKLVSIFPIEGLEKWRTSLNKNIVFYRASSKDQVMALIDYSISLGKKKFAVFYENSEWGVGIMTEIQKILDKRKQNDPTKTIELLATGSYPQNTVSVSRAVKKISEKDPDSILCISQARPAYNFIQQIINNGFIQTTFLCIDRLFSIQKTLKKSRGISIVTTSAVPDPFTSSLSIAKEYRKDMKKYFSNQNLSPFSFEGYINATILCECIKAAQFPISANKILYTIENIKRFDIPILKDLNLNFNPETRTLCNRVWINTQDGKEWEEWLFNTERT